MSYIYETIHFKTEYAVKYGLNESIILSHIEYICKIENNDYFKDGRYWYRLSLSRLIKLFPFLSKNTIKRALSNLVKENVLIKGNYNTNHFDQTCWYSSYVEQIGPIDEPKLGLSSSTVLGQSDEPKLGPSSIILKINKEVVVEESTTATSNILNSLEEFKEYFSKTPFYSRLKAPGAIILCHSYYQSLERLSDAYTDLCARFTTRKPYKESFTEKQEEAWQKDCHSFIENSILKEIKK